MSKPYIEQEIREQPRILDAVLGTARNSLESLIPKGSLERVHLVGCGDMYFSARVVAWLARIQMGADVHAWRSMDMRWVSGRLSGDDLVICSSISGRTPRTVEAARAARSAGARVIGITDNEDAPLSAEVDGLALLGTSPLEALGAGEYPGYHHQIAQTKTYTAALLAEMLAVTHACGRDVPDLGKIPGRIERAIDDLFVDISSHAGDWFRDCRRVSVLGSGSQRSTSLYGAAKFLEYAIPAHAQCIDEFNHLEIFIADTETLAIVLAVDEPSSRRASELLETWEDVGLRSIVIGLDASYPGRHTELVSVERHDPWTNAFINTVALQILAFRGAIALGRDPDRWLGGVRTDLINEASKKTIRGSKID